MRFFVYLISHVFLYCNFSHTCNIDHNSDPKKAMVKAVHPVYVLISQAEEHVYKYYTKTKGARRQPVNNTRTLMQHMHNPLRKELRQMMKDILKREDTIRVKNEKLSSLHDMFSDLAQSNCSSEQERFAMLTEHETLRKEIYSDLVKIDNSINDIENNIKKFFIQHIMYKTLNFSLIQKCINFWWYQLKPKNKYLVSYSWPCINDENFFRRIMNLTEASLKEKKSRTNISTQILWDCVHTLEEAESWIAEAEYIFKNTGHSEDPQEDDLSYLCRTDPENGMKVLTNTRIFTAFYRRSFPLIKEKFFKDLSDLMLISHGKVFSKKSFQREAENWMEGLLQTLESHYPQPKRIQTLS